MTLSGRRDGVGVKYGPSYDDKTRRLLGLADETSDRRFRHPASWAFS